MNRTLATTILAVALLALVVGCKSTTTTATDDTPPEASTDDTSTALVLDPASALSYEAGPELTNAAILFVGEATTCQMGPTGMSNPPMYNVTLTLNVTESMRGDFAAGDSASVSYTVRQQDAPAFAVGESYIVTGHYDPRVERFVATTVLPATKEALLAAGVVGKLPIGWSAGGIDIFCPQVPKETGTLAYWPEDAMVVGGEMRCRFTHRPALFVPDGITLMTEKVAPAEEIQWTNPDGDGEYTVTVTNVTDAAIEIPALLSDAEGNILWADSLIVLSKDTSGLVAHAAPGAEPVAIAEGVQATHLEAGESVSGVVNVFLLPDIEWPRGGYRVEFTFCLGQLASMQSFYYKSDHHDAIREAANTDEETTTDTPATAE